MNSLRNPRCAPRRASLFSLVCLAVMVLLVLIPTASSLLAGAAISAKEAKDHVGETTTVCGTVVSAEVRQKYAGQPAFLNLDEPYPNQVFTIVIWGSDRGRFGEPEKTYDGKRICVTGLIKSYRGKPETVATESSQIKTP